MSGTGVERARLPTIAIRVAGVAATGAVIGLATLYAYYVMFSGFAFYDDEGFLNLTVRQFVHGRALYDDVYSQYGPFFWRRTAPAGGAMAGRGFALAPPSARPMGRGEGRSRGSPRAQGHAGAASVGTVRYSDVMSNPQLAPTIRQQWDLSGQRPTVLLATPCARRRRRGV